MKIFKSVETQLFKEKVNKLYDLLGQKVESLMPDYTDYEDPITAASDYVDRELELAFSHPYQRFCCSYRMWKSTPKLGKESHWMYDSCSSDETYMQIPMDEEYGRMDYLNTGVEFIQQNNIFGVVSRHDTLYRQPGLAAIVYSEAHSEVPTENGYRYVDVDSFVRKTMMIHPYYGSPSMHEFFKLLLEWQWAFLDGGSTEPMAEISNSFLSNLGLSVKSNNNLIQALMSLPDQQVAQYYKNGYCELNEDCPEVPLIFKFWSLSRGIMHVRNQEAQIVANHAFNYLNNI